MKPKVTRYDTDHSTFLTIPISSDTLRLVLIKIKAKK